MMDKMHTESQVELTLIEQMQRAFADLGSACARMADELDRASRMLRRRKRIVRITPKGTA